MDRQIDRQIDKQIDKQIDRQIDERQINKYTYRHKDEIDKKMDGK